MTTHQDIVKNVPLTLIGRFLRPPPKWRKWAAADWRSCMAGMLLGSTAESVVEKSRTSVLAIKPQGFTSPIKPR